MIRLPGMMYIPYPLWLRQMKDLLFEGGIDICHETVRIWWNASSMNAAPMAGTPFKDQRDAALAEWRQMAALKILPPATQRPVLIRRTPPPATL